MRPHRPHTNAQRRFHVLADAFRTCQLARANRASRRRRWAPSLPPWGTRGALSTEIRLRNVKRYVWLARVCCNAGGSALVVKNRPCRRVFLLINREEALIDQLALLAKCSCGTPRRATTTFSTAFAIISIVYCSANAKIAMPSLLYVDFSHYHATYSNVSYCTQSHRFSSEKLRN